ncbi:MAG: SusC/RagA family TonB-linked outer membrane protein [Carboxylicivirga sp.]|nr:SusC/RagA family TonB-linked outer membrane protein [Carboxylicivirga sp.]
MKMTFLLALMSMLSVSAKTLSQQTKINLQLREATIVEVLDEMQEQSGFGFVFQNEELNLTKKYNFSKRGVDLREILDELFKDGSYNYRFIDNNVVIIKNETAQAYSVAQQNIRVKGTVMDANGDPLPGVNVYQKSNPQHGVITGVDGSYDIEVESADVSIVYSFIGFLTQEVNVAGRNEINVTLVEESLDISEVVVTALGISKEKKALGYAVQDVKSEELNKVASPDVGSKLQGKMSGVQINQSSTIGGSSRIVVRGESSLSLGGNEALIVVDGVPINGGSSVANAVDWGNALGDINSNDIESVSVLKGGAAAALYGSMAGNGVVLITTKSGKGKTGLSVDYSGSLMFESLLEYPDTYQYEYAVGKYQNNKLYTGNGTYNPKPYDETWSEKYDENKYIEWWYSPTSNGYRAGDVNIPDKGIVRKLPYVSSGKNNYEEFFEVGRTYYNQVSVSGSNENLNGRISFENMDQKGMQPGTDLKRNSMSSNLTLKLDDRVSVNLAMNYSNTESGNRPEKAWNSNSINYVMAWMMPGVRMDQLKDYWQPGLEGRETINWRDGHNNPYWITHEIKNSLLRDRIFGNINVNFKIRKDLNLKVRHGEDVKYENRGYYRPMGGGSVSTASKYKARTRVGQSDFLLTYNPTISDNFGFDVNFGGSNYKSEYEELTGSHGGALVPEMSSLGNAKIAATAADYVSNKEIRSVYSFLNVDYKRMVYLALTARNDWSSTLPKDNHSYFYPSATLSFLVNEMVELPSSINYLKLRGGLAQVGKDTDPYALLTYPGLGTEYQANTVLGLPSNLKNPDLKPEETTTFEVGVEAKFLSNRIGVDFTYYRNNTKNQIIPISLPQSSGYTRRMANAGEVKNSGYEISLNVTPVKTNNFTWDATVNMSGNTSEVVELEYGLDRYKITGFGDNGESVTAMVGKEVMGIFGHKQMVVEDTKSPHYGRKIYDSNGAPVQNPDSEYLGTANPDWILGFTNRFTYKNLTLNCVLDMRHGGIAYSSATNIMYGGGYNTATADWRTNGVKGDGVIANGDGTYRENDIVLKGDDIKNIWVGKWRKISPNNFFDSDFVKIRELSLTYALPQVVLNNLPISRASVSVVGRNLFTWDDIPNQDADVYREGIPGYAGNFTYPTSRTYGVTLNVSF